MSAFLGPIHHWLYHKIQLQEELVSDILEACQQNGWTALTAEIVDSACGEAEKRPLEAVIDEGNIHGWLQARLSVAEARLAFVATKVLQEAPAQIDGLLHTARNFGIRHAVPHDATASDAFQILTDCLVDGMPCDGVNQILSRDENAVSWQQTYCLHTQYWEQVSGDVAVYYALRTQIIEGMLTGSGLVFRAELDGRYLINKE